jgi:benzoyl-CoA reductase/2-hydroxyglutaryl-CoA dehydratase subunit BcrC/BadD/HgdB
MDWQAWLVDLEREFMERTDRRGVEFREMLEDIERRWKESEEARRREWEALEGRAMTGWEKLEHSFDGLLRKTTLITQEQIAMNWRVGEEIREEFRSSFAEIKEEMRANREATLKMLDRLSEPPFG